MQHVVYVFWLAVFVALLAALWDCARWPRQTAAAWRRFRPVAICVVVVAIGFFLVNLMRLGIGETGPLAIRAMRLASLAVVSSAFFCGGWPWVTRAGYVGLFERIRRHFVGLETPSVRAAAAETLLVSAVVVLFSLGLLWFVTVTFGEPQKSASFREWLESPGRPDARTGYLGLLVFLAPLWEETAFRWYLMNRLEDVLTGKRWGRVAAIVISAAVWACGHAALTDPAWFKLVHIFVVGCLLGWRFRTIGLSGCVLAHLAMNLPAVFAAP